MHDKLKIINNEDNERPSQATRLPRNFLLEKEKGDLLPLPSVNSKIKITKKVGIIITSSGNEKLS